MAFIRSGSGSAIKTDMRDYIYVPTGGNIDVIASNVESGIRDYKMKIDNGRYLFLAYRLNENYDIGIIINEINKKEISNKLNFKYTGGNDSNTSFKDPASYGYNLTTGQFANTNDCYNKTVIEDGYLVYKTKSNFERTFAMFRYDKSKALEKFDFSKMKNNLLATGFINGGDETPSQLYQINPNKKYIICIPTQNEQWQMGFIMNKIENSEVSNVFISRWTGRNDNGGSIKSGVYNENYIDYNADTGHIRNFAKGDITEENYYKTYVENGYLYFKKKSNYKTPYAIFEYV